MLFPDFAEETRIVRESRIHAYVGGDGPGLLLIHGLGGAAANWADLAPLLARYHRVLIPDLPGHGHSEPRALPHGIRSLADSVAELAEAYGVFPSAVVGHSMGSDVALVLATHWPDRIGALVLATAGGITTNYRWAQVGLRLSGRLNLSKLVARHRERIPSSLLLRRVAFAGWGAENVAGLSDRAVAGFLEGPAHSTDTSTACEALISFDPRAELSRVRQPVLLLWGSRDRMTPLSDGFEYARRLRASLRTLPACGHLLIGERPEECARFIEEFLESEPAIRDSGGR